MKYPFGFEIYFQLQCHCIIKRIMTSLQQNNNRTNGIVDEEEREEDLLVPTADEDSILATTLLDTITDTGTPVAQAVIFVNATLDDVLLSDNPVNQISKNRPQSSCLVSIMEFPIKDITIGLLRKFCTKNSVQGARGKTKMGIIQLIIEYKRNPELYTSTIPIRIANVPPVVNLNVRMNRKRFINILFSDIVRPVLADRGRPLTGRELTQGLKTDQIIHELIALEYNKVEMYVYNENAFPHLEIDGSVSTLFMQTRHNSNITWQKSKKTFSIMIHEYDKVMQRWKKSGNHGTFNEAVSSTDTGNEGEGSGIVPFSNFSGGNTSVVYLHEYMVLHPSLVRVLSGT